MQGSLLSGEHISKIFATLPETFGHQPRNPAVALIYAMEFMMVAPHSSSLYQLYKYSEHAVAFTVHWKPRNAV